MPRKSHSHSQIALLIFSPLYLSLFYSIFKKSQYTLLIQLRLQYLNTSLLSIFLNKPNMSQDPHQGGNLSDVAAHRRYHPQRRWENEHHPFCSSPGEGFDSATGITDANASKGTLAGAAGEGADIPRAYKDVGATGEVEAETG
jgi:hypothetical protein